METYNRNLQYESFDRDGEPLDLGKMMTYWEHTDVEGNLYLIADPDEIQKITDDGMVPLQYLYSSKEFESISKTVSKITRDVAKNILAEGRIDTVQHELVLSACEAVEGGFIPVHVPNGSSPWTYCIPYGIVLEIRDPRKNDIGTYAQPSSYIGITNFSSTIHPNCGEPSEKNLFLMRMDLHYDNISMLIDRYLCNIFSDGHVTDVETISNIMFRLCLRHNPPGSDTVSRCYLTAMLPIDEMDVRLKMMGSEKMEIRFGTPMMPVNRLGDVGIFNCIGWTGNQRNPDVLYLDILHSADVFVDGRCEHIPINFGDKGCE